MARKGEGDKRHATHSVGRDDQSDVVADHGRSGERGAGEEKGCRRRWWLGMREFLARRISAFLPRDACRVSEE